MAEGYLRKFADGRAEVFSAGVATHGVNPRAIQTMQDDGVNISQHTSNHIDEYRGIPFDFVITVCDNAKENCPFFPSSAEKIHHNFPDPAKVTGTEEEIVDEFTAVRDEIKEYCRTWVSKYL